MSQILSRVTSLLTPRDKHNIFLLFLGITLMAVFEVVGIASILPFLAVVANPETVQENDILRRIFEASGLDQPAFVIALGSLVLIALIVRNAFNALTTWALLTFTARKTHQLAESLLRHYMHRPYDFFLRHNTADLAKNILSEVTKVVHGLLMPMIQILAQVVVTLAVVILLGVIDLGLAIAVTVILGGAYAGVYTFTRRKLVRMGHEQVVANSERHRAAAEALGGIKELKILGREEPFVTRFSEPSMRFLTRDAKLHILSQLPRYALETFAFGGVMIIIIYLLLSGRELAKGLPLIGLYAFSTYRLMPSLQQMFSALASVRFHEAALGKLSEELADKPAVESLDSRDVASLNNHMRLDRVTYRYPSSDANALEGLTLTVPMGTSVALVGPSGSGKSTCMDLMLGLIRPSEGRILIDDVELTEEIIPSWQRTLGYVPQQIYLYDDSVTKNIAFGLTESIDFDKVRSVAKIVGLDNHVIRSLPDGYETRLGDKGIRLSGGQRQRLGIARALYHDPQTLLLDEATSALDTAAESEVFESILSSSPMRTTIAITHRVNVAKRCDQVVVIDSGRATVHGSFSEVSSSEYFSSMMAQSVSPRTAAGSGKEVREAHRDH